MKFSRKTRKKRAAILYLNHCQQKNQGLNTSAPMVLGEDLGMIVTIVDSGFPQIPLDQLLENVQESLKKYDNHGWRGNVPGQSRGPNARKRWNSETLEESGTIK